MRARVLILCSLTLASCARTVERPRVSFAVEPNMFPADWRDPSIGAWAAPLAPGERTRSRRLLERAMAKYPAALLTDNIEGVWIVGRLGFRGISAGGTNAHRRVYVANDTRENDYTDGYVEGTFHHELSSVLLRNHADRFPRRAWLATNPAGFEYGDGGVAAVKNGRHSVLWDRAHNAEGFLCEYARSSLEEDFNTIAEALFMNAPDFWERVERFPALARKVTVAIRFYTTLHSSMREAYFRRLPSPVVGSRRR